MLRRRATPSQDLFRGKRRGAASSTTPSKSAPHASLRVRIAIGVRRSVSPFEPHLVCTQLVELYKEFFIELHSALGAGIDLHHPTLYTIRIERIVPWRVERIGKVHALSVAADLDNLRTTLDGLPTFLRMSPPAHPAAMVVFTVLFP